MAWFALRIRLAVPGFVGAKVKSKSVVVAMKVGRTGKPGKQELSPASPHQPTRFALNGFARN